MQSTTAMSATEAEYIVASEAAMEAVWIRKFISGLGIVPTINKPIKMFCDNSAALHFANEPGVQRGARHYHRRYHYVRESIALGEIKLLKVHTDDNLADPFTKALPNGKLTQHARSMGLLEGLYFDPSGYAWCYTYAYIQEGVTFIAKRQFENYSPYEMLQELKFMFKKQAGVERLCGSNWNVLDNVRHRNLVLALSCNGLTSDFARFKTNKKSLKAKGKGKANGKGKDKHGYISKPKNPKPTAKEHPSKDDACHHCKEVGHWKRVLEEARKLKQEHFIERDNDVHLEVTFRKHSCYVRDVNGVELIKGNRGSNLYTVSVEDMIKFSSICLLSKASKNRSWLWHRRLHHLNFGAINDLARKDLVRSLPKLKFEKDHLCSAYQLGKIHKYSNKPKSENTNLEFLHTLHMDLCGPMRVQTINGKKYILVIVDDYSRFTWVKVLRLKDETPEFVINFLKQIQVVEANLGYYFKGTTVIIIEIPMEVEGFKPPQEEVIPIRRSERTHRAPERLCLNVEVEEHSLGDLNEPTSYKAAMLDSESDKWIDAMNAEMQSMIDNMVWVLVDLPPNCKTVGSKWLFKIKTDMDGNVHTYKARLVAKGYTQLYGVDYEETFSPVADIRAIRILISIAAFYDYEIWQMDVKTAFLNGHLDEDIYMVQPEGFVDPKHPRKVCKLQRSIYGLKQASRSWNKRFDEEIKRFGFTQNLDEPCVYQKASGSNVTFLILYVDDIIIMGNHIPSLQSVKDYLGKCFAMKDLGEAAFILGIKIYRDRSKRLIGLSQSAYMDKILKRYRMDNSKRGHIPMQERLDLNKTQGASTPEEVKRMQNVPYASAVGSIMYAVRCTRPDVAFAQNITSHFQQNPGEPHWTAVKTILKYLRNTKDMFLVYGGNPEDKPRVDCYCNAGFETDIDDMKSLIGYVSF
ncbi:retrotransposon protein, putative, ty1-copia subclass [Tanacetum coccineum]